MISNFGEICALGAAFVWAGSTGLFRSHGKNYRPQSVTLFKCLIASALLGLTIVACGISFPNTFRSTILLVLSGIIGIAIGDTFYYRALFAIGAQRASAFFSFAPIVTTVFAWLILSEVLRPIQLIGISLSTIAMVALALSQASESRLPGSQFSPADLKTGIIGIAFAIVATAIAMVFFREGIKNVNPVAGAFLRLFPSAVFLGLAEGFQQKRGDNLLAIFRCKRDAIPLGIGSTIGTYLGFILASAGMAYSEAAGIASALMFSSPVWVIPIAHYFLGERVTRASSGLTIIAMIGVILVFF